VADDERDDPLLAHGPTHLGGVKLIGLIGAGGMGRVYLGHHETLDIDVAVKVMREGDHADADRFINEARLAARIQHENIVRMLHAGREGNRLFLVQELVVGIDLKRLIEQSGSLPWRQALAFAKQAARGLAAAHQEGIVHRDIKPSNLLITPQGALKIADLGLAHDALGEDGSTETIGVLGTPAYMAPEQARDFRTAGPRADVYALGVTLYQMLSGETPFRKSSHTNMLLAHIQEPIPDIRHKVTGLPAPLVSLIQRMLAKDPAARPADGQELVGCLSRILGDGSSSTLATAIGLRLRDRVGLGAAFMVGACLVLLGMVTAGVVLSRSWWLPPRGAPPAAVGGAPLPAAAAAAPAPRQAADAAWQTPPRAVFALGNGLPPEAAVAVQAALLKSGLPVIERQRIDDLVKEQELIRQQRVDPAGAIRLGRLVGGHIAVFISQLEQRFEVRGVVVETGELASDDLADASRVGDAVTAAVAACAAIVPARGVLVAGADGLPRISLGAVHAVKLGDRFELLTGDAGRPGPVPGIATVVELQPDTATVRIDGGAPGAMPSRVRKLRP
jgi:serine/threonine-protein kinase